MPPKKKFAHPPKRRYGSPDPNEARDADMSIRVRPSTLARIDEECDRVGRVRGYVVDVLVTEALERRAQEQAQKKPARELP